MADTIFGSGTDQWVCPNDRQLALRAKLKTGWSVHTNETDRQRQNQILTKQEVANILDVIKRAETLDLVEQKRVGRLVERLENMKKNVMGNGLSQCLLCGELLGFLGSTSVFCQDCRKIWKRSGAWFYKGLPKFILPLKSTARTSELHLRPIQMEHGQSIVVNRSYSWAKGRVVSSDSESESECSSSSQDDKVSASSAKTQKTRKESEESGRKMKVSSCEPTSRTQDNYQLTNILSGSRTSLGSERGGGSSATESYSGDVLGDDYNDDFDKNSLARETKQVQQFDKTISQRHSTADAGYLK
ncbi:rab effector Noc2-like isoform X3 [Mustelus asterias]